MSESKEQIKQFLISLAKDDYATADEIFKDVVKSCTKNVINKGKGKVIDEINKNANDLAKKEV